MCRLFLFLLDKENPPKIWRYKKLYLSLLTMEQIKNLWFDGNRISMRTTNGKVYSRPLKAYMHISSFYETTEPNDQNEVAAMFNLFTWLNVSEGCDVSC